MRFNTKGSSLLPSETLMESMTVQSVNRNYRGQPGGASISHPLKEWTRLTLKALKTQNIHSQE